MWCGLRSGIHLLGGAGVDLLGVALGHDLDEALAGEVADRGAREAAVDLDYLYNKERGFEGEF